MVTGRPDRYQQAVKLYEDRHGYFYRGKVKKNVFTFAGHKIKNKWFDFQILELFVVIHYLKCPVILYVCKI